MFYQRRLSINVPFTNYIIVVGDTRGELPGEPPSCTVYDELTELLVATIRLDDCMFTQIRPVVSEKDQNRIITTAVHNQFVMKYVYSCL